MKHIKFTFLFLFISWINTYAVEDETLNICNSNIQYDKTMVRNRIHGHIGKTSRWTI